MLNQAEESAVVQGADGLLYVVADKSDKEQLISSDTPQIAEKTEGVFTAVEVGIDEKRQEKADQADQEIKEFDEIDLDDVESLQLKSAAVHNMLYGFYAHAEHNNHPL